MLTDEEILHVGFALEEGGFSHSDIDVFLSHYGVKGMKWGQRKKSEKAALIGAGVIGYQLVGALMSRKTPLSLAMAGGVAGAYGGIRLTKKLLDREGTKKLSDVFNEDQRKANKRRDKGGVGKPTDLVKKATTN